MWLVVGLGNPGPKYLMTRHNVGFMAVDFLAKGIGVRNEAAKSEFQSHTIDFRWEETPVKLVKPQTFMNLSGEAVGELMRFYKVEMDHLLIIFDDLDTSFGQIRLKSSSGDGGHNGLKSLIQHLGSTEFMRIKVGIGRPVHPDQEAADYVLQKFNQTEQEKLAEILNITVDAVESVIFDGPLKAMNTFNTKNKGEE